MEHNSQKDRLIMSLSPWKPSFDLLPKIWVKMVYLSLVGMAIPFTIFEIYQASIAHSLSRNFRFLAGNSPAIEFYKYIEVLGQYIVQYGVTWMFLGWLVLLAFFCCIKLTSNYFYGKPSTFKEIVSPSLKAFLPKGLIASLALVGLIISLVVLSARLGAVFQVLSLIIVSLSTAAPYLLLEEQKGPMQSIVSALRIKYAPNIPGIKWNVFFQLSSIQIFLFALTMFSAFGHQAFVELDETLGLSRDIWTPSSPWPPLSWVNIIATFFNSFLNGFLLMCFALVSTVYFIILKSHGILRSQHHAENI